MGKFGMLKNYLMEELSMHIHNTVLLKAQELMQEEELRELYQEYIFNFMDLKSKNKIDKNGKIFSKELITEKQGYEAMIYMLQYYNNSI